MKKLLVLPWLALLVSCTAASKIFFLFGPSQAGKTTFVKCLAGIPFEYGRNDGVSDTMFPKEYHIVNSPIFPGVSLRFIDVPGYGDNLRGVDDEHIMDQIRESVMKLARVNILEGRETDDGQIDGILIFESLENDSSRLQTTINLAKMLFGPAELDKSAAVIFTKADMAIFSGRTPNTSCCPTLPFLQWSTRCPFAGQDDLLRASLAYLAPYNVSGMQNVLAEVKRLAQLSCDQQVPTKTTVTITTNKLVEEVKMVPRMVDEWYWEYPTKTIDVPYEETVPGRSLTDFEAEVRGTFAKGYWIHQIGGRETRPVTNRFPGPDPRRNPEYVRAIALMYLEAGSGRPYTVTWYRRDTVKLSPVWTCRKVPGQVQSSTWVQKAVEEKVDQEIKRPLSEFMPQGRKAVADGIRKQISENEAETKRRA